MSYKSLKSWKIDNIDLIQQYSLSIFTDVCYQSIKITWLLPFLSTLIFIHWLLQILGTISDAGLVLKTANTELKNRRKIEMQNLITRQKEKCRLS